MDIVLASASPRRQELLKRLVDNFQIKVSDFDEDSIKFQGDIDKFVCDLAEGKARKVLNELQGNSIVIGCDTVVYLNGEILGKPINDEDAFKMLKSLSGNVHKVYSGLVLIDSENNKLIKKSICTEVKFMNLPDDMILRYIKSGQCNGKAGAYGIQDNAAVFVENINGCYYNVVGLPLNALYLSLREMGVNL